MLVSSPLNVAKLLPNEKRIYDGEDILMQDSKPVLSFGDAISSKSKAKSCNLTAYDTESRKVKVLAGQPHQEAKEDHRINYVLSCSILPVARKISLKC